jgi:uncharacterized SAM-binding protein YcdF (DUF218 family)
MTPSSNPKSSGCLPRGCLAITGGSWLILAIGLLFVFVFAEGLLTAAGRLLIYSDPPHKAETMAVLSGGGTPRLQEAVHLYQEREAPFILLTETGAITPRYGPLSQLEKDQLVEMGVNVRDIMITDTKVDSTTDEAHVIRKELSTHGFKSIIIVTDTFHSFRTHLIFQDAFKGSDFTFYIRPVRDDWYEAATWWTTWEGWQTTLLEYSKLFSYLFETRFLH